MVFSVSISSGQCVFSVLILGQSIHKQGSIAPYTKSHDHKSFLLQHSLLKSTERYAFFCIAPKTMPSSTITQVLSHWCSLEPDIIRVLVSGHPQASQQAPHA